MKVPVQTRSVAGAIAAVAAISLASIWALTPGSAQAGGDGPPADSLSIVMEFLSNTAPDKVEAASEKLVAPDATYISLNFDNPELKEILPWTGTNKGPEAYSNVFLQVGSYWKIEEFAITDTIASGEDVAIFGRFTYRSVIVGDVFTSPFSIHAKVRDGKMVYFQFMEDTYASASSFRQTGSWTVKTTAEAPSFEVGAR